MLLMTVEAAIAQMVGTISQRFSPERIILFGSQARGTAKTDSDVDLLVLFAELDNPRRTSADLYQSLAKIVSPKDIVVSTVAQFERYKNVVNTIYWPAAREGKVLYERAA